MTRPILYLTASLLAVPLVACGNAQSERTTVARDESSTGTSGGDAPPDGDAERAEPVVVVMRSTLPVPVPLTAVPRDELSAELQAVWSRVEEQVADMRPDGPAEATVENVQAWADGPFRAWIDGRRLALDETRPLLAAVGEEPPWERAVALALWAYAFEDFGAQIAGAPVPDSIAQDDELRGIYIESLNEATVPLGERAVELYGLCQQRLVVLGDDSPWLPWRAYCVQRGQEVIAGYRLAPAADGR
ncbi:MAG: hypothetical protein H6719_35575 [Sandaracinaceae bacterium]|nr:hypothetical protein [Sandaracinaceae bacterium]